MGKDVYPTVVASSVIRSTHKGESHGGVYLVDLSTGLYEQLVDWDTSGISWEGRGSDRGLRGIAFYDGHVYLAASDEVFVFDKRFNKLGSITNKYIKHCHEICIYKDILYITSTGYDSVISYDLKSHSFQEGLLIGKAQGNVQELKRSLLEALFGIPYYCRHFDPTGDDGPDPRDTVHLNSISVDERGVFICGRKMRYLIKMPALTYMRHYPLLLYSSLPKGTHNAMPLKDGYLIYNNTNNDEIIVEHKDGEDVESLSIPKYDETSLKFSNIPNDHARQGFGRGLVTASNGFVVGGSSPATVSLYKIGCTRPIKSIRMTKDVRNAIHGLELWPYESI